jgi:hypothetical protein
MVSLESGLRACQFLDVDDANLPLHKHWAAEVQHLSVDTAHQERKGLASVSLCDDGGTGTHQCRANCCSSRTVQADPEVVENIAIWEMLADASKDLLNLRTSRYVTLASLSVLLLR